MPVLTTLLAIALASSSPRPKPIGQSFWISASDYPLKAEVRADAAPVGYELAVDKSGLPTGCTVTASSGQTILDKATCRLLKDRARFTPALGATGLPVRSQYAGKVAWRIPVPVPQPFDPATSLRKVPTIATLGDWRQVNSFLHSAPRPPVPPLGVAAETMPAPVLDPTRTAPTADPRVLYGRLPNGLRYAIMRNRHPANTLSFRVQVDAGIADERDDQRGYAHLVEHMMFRGSTNVADGELERTLQKMGLLFGQDSTANTMPEGMVVGLDFPRSAVSSTTSGLYLLREMLDRATIAPDALAAERGVVLSEERFRDGAANRAGQARLSFLLKGQPVADRLTIGTVQSISAATAEGLRAFYKTLYRPDRTLIVVVGDIIPADVEREIRDRFADWKASGPLPPTRKPASATARRQDVSVFVDPGAPELTELDWISPYDTTPDDFARERRELAEDLAASILNERLARHSEQDDSPISGAVVQRGNFVHSARGTTLSFVPADNRLSSAIDAVIAEQRRLVAFGVSQPELERALADRRSQWDQAVIAGDTLASRDTAALLLASMEDGATFTTPAQAAADYQQLASAITPADVQGGAERLFGGSGPLLFLARRTQALGGRVALQSALATAQHRPVNRAEQQAGGSWPYTNFGPPGRIVDTKQIADLGVTLVRFANGTSVTIKPAPELGDQIAVDLNFGTGLSGLPIGLERSYWMVSQTPGAFTDGGLGKVAASQLAEQLSGKAVGAQFYATDEQFHLRGRTRGKDLTTELQLLTAYASDPGFRPRAVRRAQAFITKAIPEVEASAQMTAQRYGAYLLHDRDRRWFGIPTAADLEASRPEDLPALLKPALAGPLNLVIVGAVDVEQAIQTARATIGALPMRTKPAALRDMRFPLVTSQPAVEVHHGRSDQSVALAAWPIPAFFRNTHDARAIQITAEIIKSRLLDGLREKSGLTYAPTVYTDQSELSPTYGMLAAEIEIAPSSTKLFYAELSSIIVDLSRTPVSVEELSGAQNPIVETSKAMLGTTDYWLQSLAGADSDPRRFDTIRTRLSDLLGVSAADVQRLAGQYLAKSPFQFIVRGASSTSGSISSSVVVPGAGSGTDHR